MKKMKMLLEAVIVITVVTALIMPGSAVVTNESETTTNKIIDTVKEYRKVLPIEGSSRGDGLRCPRSRSRKRRSSRALDWLDVPGTRLFPSAVKNPPWRSCSRSNPFRRTGSCRDRASRAERSVLDVFWRNVSPSSRLTG